VPTSAPLETSSAAFSPNATGARSRNRLREVRRLAEVKPTRQAQLPPAEARQLGERGAEAGVLEILTERARELRRQVVDVRGQTFDGGEDDQRRGMARVAQSHLTFP